MTGSYTPMLGAHVFFSKNVRERNTIDHVVGVTDQKLRMLGTRGRTNGRREGGEVSCRDTPPY